MRSESGERAQTLKPKVHTHRGLVSSLGLQPWGSHVAPPDVGLLTYKRGAADSSDEQ